MFDLATWSNPETLMLNLTNLGLGLFTLWIVVSVLVGCMQEFRHHHHGTGGRHH